jgi:hypothetical protein
MSKTNGKATESKLSTLHGVVADVLTAQLSHQVEDVKYDEDGEAVPTGVMMYTASPATVAAAIKFLKDNSITADIEQNENLNSLREVLANKKKRSRLGNPIEDAKAH